MTKRFATAVVLLGLAASACGEGEDDAVACKSGGAEDRRYFALFDTEWEQRGADGSPNNGLTPFDVDWYVEYERSVPPPPGAFAATETMNVSGYESGLDEQVTQLSEVLGGAVLEFSDADVDGRRARTTTTGGRGGVGILYLEVRDDYTLELLGSELERDELLEVAAQLDAVCQDEWFDAIEGNAT